MINEIICLKTGKKNIEFIIYKKVKSNNEI